jgi:endonuclease/exonuclease/phosphatase family metal-dependent hydrolase
MKKSLIYLPLLFVAFFNVRSSSGQEIPVKVMTFNIRYDNPADSINSWDNRKELVISALFSASPDVFGMQEVLKSQLGYLLQNLPGYRFAGVGREDGNPYRRF